MKIREITCLELFCNAIRVYLNLTLENIQDIINRSFFDYRF